MDERVKNVTGRRGRWDEEVNEEVRMSKRVGGSKNEKCTKVARESKKDG